MTDPATPFQTTLTRITAWTFHGVSVLQTKSRLPPVLVWSTEQHVTGPSQVSVTAGSPRIELTGGPFAWGGVDDRPTTGDNLTNNRHMIQ